MKNGIYATVIFRTNRADYHGNNSFFGEVCEKLDHQAMTVAEIAAHNYGDIVKVSVEIATSANDEKPDEVLCDETQVCEWLENKMAASGLPSPYLILVDTANTEFSQREASNSKQT